MFVIDTDTMTHLQHGHGRVVERVRDAGSEVLTTLISRIEILRGRFASVLKAEDGEQLLLACQRLADSEAVLSCVPILPVNATVAAELDRLRQQKKLKKIGRADLLIAAIALAHRATLVTRNVKDFRQVPGLQVENWVD
jgi:tRNA(fMet)-specific endonuclease VapC